MVKVGNLHIAARAHCAAIGLQLPQNHFQQRRLAHAVIAHQRHFVAAHDVDAKAIHQDATVISFAHIFQLGHQLAAFLARVNLQVHTALHAAARGMFAAQFTQAVNPRCGARAPGLNPFAYPDFFLRQQFVGFGVDDGFLLELLVFVLHISGKVAQVAAQHTAIEFHNARGHRIQKSTVVADGDNAATEGDQQLLQPNNRFEIQMVGWLIEQQNIRPRHQCLRQSHAFFHAARQSADHALAIELQALQRFAHALLPNPAIVGFDLALQAFEIAFAPRILLN